MLSRNAKNLAISRSLSAIIKTTKEVENKMIGFPVGNLSHSYRFRRPCGVVCKLFLEEVADFNPVNDNKGFRKLVIKIKDKALLPLKTTTRITRILLFITILRNMVALFHLLVAINNAYIHACVLSPHLFWARVLTFWACQPGLHRKADTQEIFFKMPFL